MQWGVSFDNGSQGIPDYIFPPKRKREEELGPIIRSKEDKKRRARFGLDEEEEEVEQKQS